MGTLASKITTLKITSGEETSNEHLTVERRVTYSPSVNRSEITWTGPYDKLVSKLGTIAVGASADSQDFNLPDGQSDSEGDYGPCRYSGAVLTRTPGNNGRLVVSVVQTVHRAVFGIDFVEVSKPIRTWHADRSTDAPDLGKIRQWEEQKEGNPALYWAYKVQSEDLTGDTRTLAEMISRGIETYSLYAPVFTVSLTIDQASRVGDSGLSIGKIGSPTVPYGWKDARDRAPEDVYGNFEDANGQPYEWLLVKSTITPNSDGTHQWTLAWQGADSIEGSLYS